MVVATESQIECAGTGLLELARFFEAAMTTLLHGGPGSGRGRRYGEDSSVTVTSAADSNGRRRATQVTSRPPSAFSEASNQPAGARARRRSGRRRPPTRWRMSSPTSSARQPGRRASGSPRSRATRSLRVASSAVSIAFAAGELADPGRHQRHGGAQRPIEVVASVPAARAGSLAGRAHRVEELRAERTPAWRSSRPRACAGRRRRRAAVWAMPRIARSGSTWRGPGCRPASPGARATRPPPGRHPAPCGRSCRTSLSAARRRRDRRDRRAAGGAPRTRRAPTPCGRARRAGRRAGRSSSSRWATSAAAYACWSSVSGRRSQSVSRSPLGTRSCSSPCSSDDQRRRGVAEEAGGQLGVEQPGRDRTAGAGQHVEILLGGVQHGDRRARAAAGTRLGHRRADRRAPCRPARPTAPGRAAGSRCARGGTRCRARSAARPRARPARPALVGSIQRWFKRLVRPRSGWSAVLPRQRAPPITLATSKPLSARSSAARTLRAPLRHTR